MQVAFCILPVGDLPLLGYSDILVSESLCFPHEPAIPYLKLKTEALNVQNLIQCKVGLKWKTLRSLQF